MPPKPMDRETLFQRRLAYRALDLALRMLEVYPIAIRLNPDDPRVELPTLDGGWRFAEDWRHEKSDAGLATVYLELESDPPSARVIIPRLAALIRVNHRQDFDVGALGIKRSALGDDVDLSLDLSETLEQEGEILRAAPQRAIAIEAARTSARPRSTLANGRPA